MRKILYLGCSIFVLTLFSCTQSQKQPTEEEIQARIDSAVNEAIANRDTVSTTEESTPTQETASAEESTSVEESTSTEEAQESTRPSMRNKKGSAQKVHELYQSGVLNEGMTEDEVLDLCGKPTKRSREGSDFRYSYGELPYNVDISFMSGKVFMVYDFIEEMR